MHACPRACLSGEDLVPSRSQSLLSRALWRVTSQLDSRSVDSTCLRNQAGDDCPLEQVDSWPPVSTRTPLRFEDSIPLLHNCLKNTVLEHIFEHWNRKCVTDIHTRTPEGKRPALWRFTQVHANTMHPTIKMKRETVSPHLVYILSLPSLRVKENMEKTVRDCGEAEKKPAPFCGGRIRDRGYMEPQVLLKKWLDSS